MKTLQIEQHTLPATKSYETQPTLKREVASFVLIDGEWKYHSRGTWLEAENALRFTRPGFIAGLGTFDPADVRVILDQPSYRDLSDCADRPDMCWSGPQLTVEQFRQWQRMAE